jgi:hypothetical protein
MLSLIASTPALGGTSPPTEVALQAGAYVPIFFVYETPGFAMSADLARRLTSELSVDLTSTVGLLAAPGLRRGSGAITAGLRYHLLPRLWLRMGVGAAGYREHIAVASPERSLGAVDHGGALVLDTSLGIHLGQRWRLNARFETNLVASRGMDFIGTATVLFGSVL